LTVTVGLRFSPEVDVQFTRRINLFIIGVVVRQLEVEITVGTEVQSTSEVALRTAPKMALAMVFHTTPGTVPGTTPMVVAWMSTQVSPADAKTIVLSDFRASESA